MKMTRSMALAIGGALLAGVLGLGGCGKSDVGSKAVSALEKSFRSGEIVDKMSSGEQIAFAHLSKKGFRKRGSHVFEGYGVQYRIVRVEAVEVDTDDLQRKNDDGDTVQLIQDGELRDKIENGAIAAVAEVAYEIVPSENFLEENAYGMVAGGANFGGLNRGGTFYLVRDADKQWTIALGTFRNDLRTVLRVYQDEDNKLDESVVKRELADRLITDAPDDDEQE